MKLAIVIPIWKRPELTRHALRHYARTAAGGDAIELVVVGSEGDASRRLAESALRAPVLRYIEAPNEPLDAKFDAGFAACAETRPEAVALVGSDDFLSLEYFRWAVQQLAGGADQAADLAGLLDFHLVDTARRQVLHWAGYDGDRRGEPIGAGRVFSRRILDAVGWRPHLTGGGYQGYQRDDERALARVRAAGGRVRTARLSEVPGARFWAVKSGSEMNPISAFLRAGGTSVVPLWPDFAREFPELA